MISDKVDIRKVSLNDTTAVFPDDPISHRSKVYPGEFAKVVGSAKPAAIKIVSYTVKKEREVSNLLELDSHANVVRIFDQGIVSESIVKTMFIAMEKCQNISLQLYYLKRKEELLPFNTKQALEFVQQLTRGLNYIHERDIIHRDLKPDNILFSMDGKNLKIASFGVSKRLNQGLSKISISTQNIGTDGYRAPETYTDGFIEKSSDIFSLGIVFYHVWTYGSHPFGDDPDIWSYNIKRGKINERDDFTGRLLIPDADNEARDLLLRMLKTEHSERFVIAQVMGHRYIREDSNRILLDETKKIWHCNVEGVKGMGDMAVKECSLRTEPTKCYSEFEESGVAGQISIVRAISLQSLLSTIGGRPNGYLCVDVKAHENLLTKLGMELYQMAWLGLFHDEKICKAFVIIRPPGYEELVAILIDGLEKFVSNYKLQAQDERSVYLLGLKKLEHQLDLSEWKSGSDSGSSKATDSTADSMAGFKGLLVPSGTTKPQSSDVKGFIPYWFQKTT